MPVDIYNALKAIRDDLRSNLTDPINRNGPQWIHVDAPDFEKTTKTPQIFIEQTPGSQMMDWIGSGAQEEIIAINIHIIDRTGDTGILSSTQMKEFQINTVLANDIISRLESVASGISPTYIKMLRRTSSGGIVEIDERTFDRVMRYEVFLQQTAGAGEAIGTSVEARFAVHTEYYDTSGLTGHYTIGTYLSGSSGDTGRVLTLQN